VHLPTPRHVTRIDVHQRAADARRGAAAGAAHDVFVATAAVADWRPAAGRRAQDQEGRQRPVPAFELTENPDILATVARLPRRPAPWCVGFAAESHDLVRHAREKLQRKGVPLIVGNLGPATFGRDDNALVLVDAARRARTAGVRQAGGALARAWCARSPALQGPPRHDHIDVKVLDPRMAEQMPPTPRPAAPAWTCAPASTRRWCWRPARRR
jgi:hypothetical protein